MNILYVEDNPNDAALVGLYARATQHNLILARRRDEAHSAMVNNPDLILIDLILAYAPDGFKIARELRKQGVTKPIVAVTALATHEDWIECQRAGFTDILTKPYTIHQLADIITKYTR